MDDDIKRSKAWPGGPQILSRKLRRLAPALRVAGIDYSENEEGRNKKKIKTLKWIIREGRDESPGEDHDDEAAPDDEEQTEDPYNFEDIWLSDPEEQGGE